MEMILKISAVSPENFAMLCAWLDAPGGLGRHKTIKEALSPDPIYCADIMHPTLKGSGYFNVPVPIVSVLSSKPYQGEGRKTKLVVEIKVMTHYRDENKILPIPRAFLEHALDLLCVLPR